MATIFSVSTGMAVVPMRSSIRLRVSFSRSRCSSWFFKRLDAGLIECVYLPGAMIRYGFLWGGISVIVMSWSPSNDGMLVFTSTIIYLFISEPVYRPKLNLWGSQHTLSTIWINSGEAPTEAPGIIPPSSVMAVASTITTSSFLFGRSFV